MIRMYYDGFVVCPTGACAAGAGPPVLSHAMLLVPCNGLCESVDRWDTQTIKPGHSKPTGQDPDGVLPAEILSISQAVLGCLPFPSSAPDRTVRTAIPAPTAAG
jgi:hypothetical protein